MKFLMLYKPADRARAESGAPPSQAEIERMGKLIEKMTRAGLLLLSEGCAPTAKGAKVRQTNGTQTAIDGPFTEAKEVIGGLAMMRADSKEHAIQLAKEFLQVAGDGEVEIRQVYEPGDIVCASEGF